MSLLLDALKQAERNKQRNEPRPEAGLPEAELPLDVMPLRGNVAADKPEPRAGDWVLPLNRDAPSRLEPNVANNPSAGADDSADSVGLADSHQSVPSVARAMGEPPLWALPPSNAGQREQEQRQQAKQLFAVKQRRLPRPRLLLSAVLIGLVATTLAALGAYWWQVVSTPIPKLPPLAARPLPAPTPSVPNASAPGVSSTSAPSATRAAAPTPAPATQSSVAPADKAGAAAIDTSAAQQPDTSAGNAPAAASVAAPGQSASPETKSTSLAATTASSQPLGAEATAVASTATTNSAAQAVPTDGDVSDVQSAVPSDEQIDEAPMSLAQQPKKETKKRAPHRSTKRRALPVDEPLAEAGDSEEPAQEAAQPRRRAKRVSAAQLEIRRTPAQVRLDARVAAGYRALVGGELDAAQQYYAAAVRDDALNIDARLGLATVAASRGQRDAAREQYRHVLELDPKNAVALAGLAGLGGNGGGVIGESTLKTHLAEQPGSHQLHFALGNDLAAQGRWSEAQQAYFNAHRLDPDNPDYLYNLAVALDQLQQSRVALQFYERAVAAATTRAAQFDTALIAKRIADLKQ